MKVSALVVLLPLALLAGCSSKPESATPATAAASAPPPTAHAMLTGASGTTVNGDLKLARTTDGVLVNGDIYGLYPSSKHGFHVHEKGDCSATDASSAGGIFNPDGKTHGNPGSGEHQLGDLPNLVSDAKGMAEASTTIVGATLGDGGPHDIMGKAIVVDGKPDDYKTQPAGNSGERIACGVIAAIAK
jgi:Cu-Zn family superoxide dismutase